jgi:hypothetical protein
MSRCILVPHDPRYDDDTALDAGADVGPVNLWMHFLFSDVSVSLNEKLVSPPTSLYPYRAYIETLLSYGPVAKESQLTGVMWYKDTPGHQYNRTTDNKGFTSRKALTAQSKSVQMLGKLHLDLFCQEKYLLNHVNLNIKLRRCRDVFALMADAAFPYWYRVPYNYEYNLRFQSWVVTVWREYVVRPC